MPFYLADEGTSDQMQQESSCLSSNSCGNNAFAYCQDDVDSDSMSEISTCSVSQTSSDSSSDESVSTTAKLFQFYVKHNISVRAMNDLLQILRAENVVVPPTFYLLKKENMAKVKTENSAGYFGYFSIKENLKFLCSKKRVNFKDKTNIDLSFNIDGLPLFKSSKLSVWPILMTVQNLYKTPLPIAYYVGTTKPPFTEYFDEFLKELKILRNSYVNITDDVDVKVNNILFVCDAPVRAFIQGVKGHTSYSGCPYCRVEGEYESNRVVFPYSDSYVARTNEFYQSGEEENQLFRSPFNDVVSLVDHIPPEYMHLVCIGVTKKLLKFYAGLSPVRACRIPKMQQDSMMGRYTNQLPSEFQRQLRNLDNVHHFKATECRTWLLYAGPVFFRKVLPDKFYDHFLLLHFSIYVLCSPSLRHHIYAAEMCLKKFVYLAEILFGKQFLTYNVHCLQHLTYYVRMYGCLDTFSSFPFENYLSSLKRRIKCGSNINSQVSDKLLLLRDHLQPSERSISYSSTFPNNYACVENEGEPCFIEIDSISSTSLSGYKLLPKKPLYERPYSSSAINIGVFSKSSIYLAQTKALHKCVPFIKGSSVVLFPFANTQSM